MDRVLPRRYVAAAVVALALAASAGWLLHWWVVVPWYDEIVHLMTGAVFVTPLLAMLLGPERAAGLQPWRAVTLGAFAWSGVGAGWELAEWSLDAIFGTNTLKVHLDTISDMAFNAGGALSGMLIAARPASR